MNKNPISPNSVSSPFVAQHADLITGVLHCWDRIRFLGTLRTLQSVHGMMGYLQRANVLLKDFRQYVSELTARVRQQSEQIAEAAGRPAHYLHGSLVRKDGLARQAAEKDAIEEGLIGLWSCVEPCRTFFVSRDPRRKILFLEFAPGKCLHHYFYFADPQFGLMHLRLQTWFPFGVSVCVNGHLWLARLMDQAGIAYRQQENCFTWIEDPEGAQRLASSQLQTDWAAALNRLLGQCHPLWEEICRPIAQQYYWSAQESEFSSDVLFASRRELERLYPRLIRHAIINFGSRDVLRFLGQSEKVRGTCQYEIKSSLKARPEGLRVKHTAAGNSVKIYDKQATVLRTETTISQTEVFRVYREPEPAAPADAPQNQGRWMRMRKGVADMHRRAEVSQAANERICARWPWSPAVAASAKPPIPFSVQCQATAVGTAPSIPGLTKTPPFSKPSTAANGPSTAFAIAICGSRSTARKPIPLPSANRPPVSPACWRCFALTASSKKLATLIATTSPTEAVRSSPPSKSLAKPPLKNSSKSPHENPRERTTICRLAVRITEVFYPRPSALSAVSLFWPIRKSRWSIRREGEKSFRVDDEKRRLATNSLPTRGSPPDESALRSAPSRGLFEVGSGVRVEWNPRQLECFHVWIDDRGEAQSTSHVQFLTEFHPLRAKSAHLRRNRRCGLRSAFRPFYRHSPYDALSRRYFPPDMFRYRE